MSVRPDLHEHPRRTSPSTSSLDRPRCSAKLSSCSGFAWNVPSNAFANFLFHSDKKQVDSRMLSKFSLTGTRAVSRNPIAVQKEAKMNKNDLVSHVAAETSATRVAAERMVGAVFSAIADALARDEPVAIAGFGQFVIRGRAARRGRNPQTGGSRRHRGLEGAVVQGGEGPSRRGQRIAWRAKRPGARRSSRQRRRDRCTPSPCIGVKALGLENGSFPCACVRPIYEPALHASRGRPTPFTPRAIGLPTGPTRWGAARLGQGQSSTTATARRHCRAVVRPPKHCVPEKPSDMGNPRLPEISVFFPLQRHSAATATDHRMREPRSGTRTCARA